MAEALHRLGIAYHDLGNAERALELLREAEGIHRKLPLQRPNARRVELCGILQTLGALLSDLGYPEQAITVLREAEKICRELVQVDPAHRRHDLAGILGNLANALDQMGDPEQAVAVLREAEKICRELARVNPAAHLADLATTLVNLSPILFSLDDATGAARVLREALDFYRELAERRPDIYRSDLAWTLNQLGAVLRNLGDAAGAITVLREAEGEYRELARLRPEAFRRHLAAVLGNMGGYLGEQGDPEAAAVVFKEALEVYRELARQQPLAYAPALAKTLGNLGTTFAKRSIWVEAIRAFREAESLYDWIETRTPTAFLAERIRLITTIGLLLLRDDRSLGCPDLLAAREVFQKVRRLTERFRGRFKDRNHRRRILQGSMAAYNTLVEICLVLGSSDARQEAVEVAEASRARALMELLAEQELAPANTPAGLTDEFRVLRRNLREALLRLEMEQERQTGEQVQLARRPDRAAYTGDTLSRNRSSLLIDALPQTPSDKRLSFLTGEVERLTTAQATSLEQIRMYDSGFDPDQPVPPISFPTMQALIPTDRPTAVVLYVLFEDRGAALVITRDGLTAIELPDLSARQVTELAYQWGKACRGLSIEDWKSELPRRLEPVARAAIWPLIGQIQLFQRVILVPAGAMHLFPLHAAVVPNGTYLADHVEVGYTPSLSVLALCRHRTRPTPTRLLTAVVPDSIRDKYLHYAEPEAEVIRQHFVEVAEKRGRNVSRQWMLNEAGSHEVIHYSGHSIFRPADPLLSGLVLESGRTPDKWLTLRDVYCGLHLRQATLVVLSGCESGMVVPDQLDEYLGLPLGFLYAGASCVLGSLWAVDDPVTMLTMDQFYVRWQGGRKGVTVGAALAAAQAWLRTIPSGPALQNIVLAEDFQRRLGNDRNRRLCRAWANEVVGQCPDAPPFASPVYWAPFVATGLSYAIPTVPKNSL